ncbi:9710_t:CDS:2 [Ambispora gerdemannii]|uniref:9710_t:CDS:1 n=1 Tax=Ambispora gerdemannii TaxID=144530 RepID=A0A9N9AGE5_9GLOM|nr:9710_t:CDS:2 [Ambispora gerdemannii]
MDNKNLIPQTEEIRELAPEDLKTKKENNKEFICNNLDKYLVDTHGNFYHTDPEMMGSKYYYIDNNYRNKEDGRIMFSSGFPSERNEQIRKALSENINKPSVNQAAIHQATFAQQPGRMMEFMEKKVNILQGGSVYFFYRPKVENNAIQKEEVQRFFFVLQPQNQSKYQLLIVGKKQLPTTEKNSYFLFLEAIKNNKEELLAALNEKHYLTKTRGERTLPVSHCLGAGKYLLVSHNNHTHFIYQLTNPSQVKEIQKEFNLQKEDDYLINIKNPQAATPPGVGLAEKQKVKFPPSLQNKFAHYSFIPLATSEFLNYEGAELLLISTGKENLTSRVSELESCLKKIHPDNLLDEFAKISSPVVLSPIKE